MAVLQYKQTMNQFNAPLWGDESFSAILSMHSLPDIIKIIINDTSPPLWNIFEWIVFNTLGTDEVYIRALAFTFFLTTIFFVYKIANLLFDKKTALIATALTALNPFFFTYAFEGRMYSIMSAGVAGSMYFFSTFLFQKGNKTKINKLHLVGYIFMTLWALYSHHFAIFAVMAQGLWFLYLLAKRSKQVVPMFLGFLAVGIGYSPWLWPLYNQTRMVGTGFWLGRPKLIDLTALTFEYLAFGVKHLFAFPALVMVGAAFTLRKWAKDVSKSLFLATWFIFPILATFIVSQFFTPIFFNRYLLYTIPGAMILIASVRRTFSNIVIGIILVLFAAIDVYYFTHPVRPRFDLIASYVKDTMGEGDYLINWYATPHFLWESKYYGIPTPLYLKEKGSLPFFVGTALMKPTDIINELPSGIKRVGVITSGAIEDIELPGYTETERKVINNLKFVWYQKSD